MSVQCTDDPDYQAHQYTNDQPEMATVWFTVDAYSTGHGEFDLRWAESRDENFYETAAGRCSLCHECCDGRDVSAHGGQCMYPRRPAVHEETGAVADGWSNSEVTNIGSGGLVHGPWGNDETRVVVRGGHGRKGRNARPGHATYCSGRH